MNITNHRNRGRPSKRKLSWFQLSGSVLSVFCVVLCLVTVATESYFSGEEAVDGAHSVHRKPIPRHLLRRGPGGGITMQASTRSNTAPLRIEDLRGFCAMYAPELKKDSLDGRSPRLLPAVSDNNTNRLLPAYPFLPNPVCFRHDVIYYDGPFQKGRRLIKRKNVDHFPRWAQLTDAVLEEMQKDTSIDSLTFVPAIGIFPLSRFSVGQLYHSMNDLVRGVMVLMTEVGDTASTWGYSVWGKSPVQFLTLPHRRLLWPRAQMSQSVPQTAHLMGAFSYPTAPPRYFFADSPVLNNNAVYCTCKGLVAMHELSEESFEQKSVAFRLASDLLRRYMNETPYESEQDLVSGDARAGGVPLSILRRFSHVPHIARRFWTTEAQAMARHNGRKGSNDTVDVPAYRPRLLLINRRRRRIHDFDAVAAVAEKVGFNVQTVYLEELSLEEQFHIGRHADVMMGMHGMGLTHVLWMDGRLRDKCRALIELMPFGCPRVLTKFYQVFADAVGIHYEYISADDMYLGDRGNDVNAATTQEELRVIKKAMLTCNFTFKHRGFVHQVAIYNMSLMEDRLVKALNRLKKCGVA